MKNRTHILAGASAFIVLVIAFVVYAQSSGNTPSVSSTELNALFQFADKNKDGSISKTEFEQYLLSQKAKPLHFANYETTVAPGSSGAQSACCGGKSTGEEKSAKSAGGSCCGGDSKESAGEDSKSVAVIPSDVTANEHETLKVGGLCGMCKKRIEAAAKSVQGVVAASWDKESQILKIDFNSPQTSLDAISKAIAKVGHDTDKDKADNKVYDALHGCCKYRG